MMQYIDQQYKDVIGKKLTNRIGMAIERNELQSSDIVRVCDMILPVLDVMNTREEIQIFLQKLAAAWPFFTDIIKEQEQVTYFASASKSES